MPDLTSIDAIVLDVDGTLYRQGPVRRQMALRLAGACVTQPLRTRRAVRVIRSFRANLESIRASLPQDEDHPAHQLRRTIDQTGVRKELVESLIEEWMFERPLALIGSYPRKGLHRFLGKAIKHGLRLSVFSEYPSEGKLESLGVRDPFSVVLSSCDPTVRRFKPDPTGFLRAAEELGSEPARTLVIGDRDDADGAGARAAGMRYLEIGGSRFPSFVPLSDHLFGP
ncbi:MAG: HAD-IA family hydrolase [Acidobacteria bacterium]|nr:HAD-IA family hydrolase [Acidobacteriota bacterium]NIM60342.1 HAD-IA family hydrolase [Acidobacteriota bacterium]NIO60343.1 HAD-IA family hydrolase [Acidobacteriota bacterium]NIQ31398.1 HAD-IA family hydrolase [Acidobacteriota bacterium]NIQ86624.1 HAD-IA family hydrolase [Acidobacteriota bacterium]